MANKISSADKSALLNLAASLPKGDPIRKSILAALKKVEVETVTASTEKSAGLMILPFTRGDWMSYSGAERFKAQKVIIEEAEPWITHFPVPVMPPWSDFTLPQAVGIADANGLSFDIGDRSGDTSYILSTPGRGTQDPAQAKKNLEAAVKILQSGRIPPGMKVERY